MYERVLVLLDEYFRLATTEQQETSLRHVFKRGQLIASRFRIVRFLESGGMGQVYEAFDERLQLRVAIKTLHPSILNTEDAAERFRREIRIALEVSHENLCRVYDLLEDSEPGKAAVNCLTMEFLEGETLQLYLQRKRPLAPSDALPVLRQLAGGLNALHEHGIIHRDLKPSNILMTSRPNGSMRIVVTDFGLAKSIRREMELFETQTEMQAGAPLYMAPELWTGVRPSIASDIYAFGMIIDDLVTRTPVFNAGSIASLCYSKLHEEPIPPGMRADELPSEWERVILRCLEKDPDRRYPTVAAIMAELSDLVATRVRPPQFVPGSERRTSAGSAASGSTVPSVAIMPFEDLSPQKDQGHFCDGLTEEIIHLLSLVKDLRVVAHTSVFALRQAKPDPCEIGRKLRVTNILEGSFRRIGDDIRLITRFVDASEGFTLYSKRYDRKLTDVFAIQDEIAGAVVGALRIEVLDRLKKPRAPEKEVGFYSCYLHGLQEFHQQTVTSLHRALGKFKECIALNPNFAPTRAALADSYATLEWYGALSPTEAMPIAEREALAALQLDPNLAAAHCTLGVVKARYLWDWDAAASEFETALRKNSGLARTHFSYALDYLTPRGELDTALGELQQAQQLDPLSLIVRTAVAGCYFRKREYQRAIDILSEVRAVDPNFYHAHWSSARCHEQMNDYSSASQAYRTAAALGQNTAMILAELGHCSAKAGDLQTYNEIQRKLNAMQSGSYVSPLCFAFLHLGSGDIGRSLSYVEQALEDRSGMLVWLGLDPRWDHVRANSRFAAVLSEIGLNPKLARVM
ncbi:MAG: protein kinase domain-containing protein [Bryobacteraceae bacterium]